MNRLWLLPLVSLLVAPALAQKGKGKSKEQDLYLYSPPTLSYVTVGGFYPNSARAVSQGQNPYLSATWRLFSSAPLLLSAKGETAELNKDTPERVRLYQEAPKRPLDLVRSGMFVDFVRGTRGDSAVTSLGFGTESRLFRLDRNGVQRKSPAVSFGLGFGYYTTWVRDASLQRGQRTTGFGLRPSLQIETRDGVVVEGGYRLLPSAVQTHPRGFFIQAGFRF